MKHLRRIGALFTQDAFGYWRALYVLLLVVWGISTIWRVALGALLETPDSSPTLIKIGLLEAVAFLAAWSLLLITITTKVVNAGRDIESVADESNRKLDEMKADFKQHKEKQTAAIEELEAEVSQSADLMNQLKGETEEVAEENERLRRQLAATARKDLNY